MMQWFLLGVVVIALLYMSSRYPKVAFSILGALALAAAVIVFSTTEDASRARQKLPVDAIKIENAVIADAYGGSHQLNARLVNTHASILLKEAVLSITMLDCKDDSVDSDDCTVIGQANERVTTKIPAQQARDISINVFFNDAEPSGTLRWKFQVTETRS